MSLRTSHTKTIDTAYVLFPEAGHVQPFVAPIESASPWLDHESDGKLGVDVFETEKEVIVQSAIAGIRPEDLEVFMHNDMLTIRGTRTDEHREDRGRYLVQECHWGAFSRSLILPSDVNTNSITATLKEGVLTIKLPKTLRSKKIPVRGL